MNKTTSILRLAISMAIVFTFSCSSGDDGGSDSGGGSSSPSSGGGGNKCTNAANCKKKQIGNQLWMAENLNIDVKGSKCYGEGGKVLSGYDDNGDEIYTTLSNAEIQANCAKYGRLYTWAAAMGIDAKYNKEKWGGSDEKRQGICPSGWHIPSNDDWNVLMKTVYPSCSSNSVCEGAGTKLKTTSEWSWSYEGKSGNGTDEFGFSALPGGQYDSREPGEFDFAGAMGVWWSSAEDDKTDAICRAMYSNVDVVYWGECTKDFLSSVRCVQDN